MVVHYENTRRAKKEEQTNKMIETQSDGETRASFIHVEAENSFSSSQFLKTLKGLLNVNIGIDMLTQKVIKVIKNFDELLVKS